MLNGMAEIVGKSMKKKCWDWLCGGESCSRLPAVRLLRHVVCMDESFRN